MLADHLGKPLELLRRLLAGEIVRINVLEGFLGFALSCLHQAFGGSAGFVGDFGAGEHSGDFFAAGLGIENFDRGDRLAFDLTFGDPPVMPAARGDLGRMGDDQNLRALG